MPYTNCRLCATMLSTNAKHKLLFVAINRLSLWFLFIFWQFSFIMSLHCRLNKQQRFILQLRTNQNEKRKEKQHRNYAINELSTRQLMTHAITTLSANSFNYESFSSANLFMCNNNNELIACYFLLFYHFLFLLFCSDSKRSKFQRE